MKKRYYLLLVFLGVSAIVAGWIYESQLRTEDGRADLSIPDNIDYYMTNINYRSMTETGDLDFEFSSIRLEHRLRTDISHIERPMLHIVRTAGNWKVDSRLGEFVHQTNLLRLREQVVMQRQGPDPLEIRSQSIVFEPDADRVTSESDIVLNSAHAQIQADHGVFDLNRGIYRLRKARAIYSNDQS